MRTLSVFNSISLDGYFVDSKGDMSWAHNPDPEFQSFTEGNAKGGGLLVMGRITYDLMKGYWPSPMAMKSDPVVAERMNALPKLVFSRTLGEATWSNTRLVKGGLAAELRNLKKENGPDMVIMGSGSIVAQIAGEGLVDEYQLVVVPVILGGGRTLFEGVGERIGLRLAGSRSFPNGNLFLRYVPGN